MVTSNKELDTLADELTDRLVQRGRVPARLRSTAQVIMRTELLRALQRVVLVTSRNAGALVAASRSGF